MRVALVHYAAPPVIGGVERVLEQQAKMLRAHGHEVVVLCGNEGAGVPDVEVKVIKALAAGGDGSDGINFTWKMELASVLEHCEVMMVHNMFTMPFNPLAAAELARWSERVRTINWVHDVDVDRDWFEGLNLHLRHVTVSEARKSLLQQRLGVKEEVLVVPNGVDVAATLGWSERMRSLVTRHRLLERDLVMFHPARVLARKNMEKGVEVLKVLRDRGMDAVYVISGAPDPHRASSAQYARLLLDQVRQWNMEDVVWFMASDGPVMEDDLRSMYQLGDVVFFPSKVEGFGLPLVEATLHGVPVLCSDIEPHREVAGTMRRVEFFSLQEESTKVAEQLLQLVKREGLMAQERRQVAARFSWSRIYQDYVEGLLNGV